MKSIYSFKSYKTYIKALILHQGRGSIGHLSEAAGCNRTYLSQCLSSKVQLTADHIIGISEYLKHSDEEQNFFLLLLLYERAVTSKAQQNFKTKIDKIAQDSLILSKKISDKLDSQEITDNQKHLYYSSWKYGAVHTLTSIKDFQTSSSISKKLNLSQPEVNIILNDLLQMNLIINKSTHWIHSGVNIHVPAGSAFMFQNHVNWRLKALDSVGDRNSIHYTTLFSLTKKDWEHIREQLLTFINNQRDQIHQSGSEEIYCFNCDLFKPFE